MFLKLRLSSCTCAICSAENCELAIAIGAANKALLLNSRLINSFFICTPDRKCEKARFKSKSGKRLKQTSAATSLFSKFWLVQFDVPPLQFFEQWQIRNWRFWFVLLSKANKNENSVKLYLNYV